MNVLITGGTGFVGKYLQKELLKNGHEVVGIDDLSGGYESFLTIMSILITLHNNIHRSLIQCTIGSKPTTKAICP